MATDTMYPGMMDDEAEPSTTDGERDGAEKEHPKDEESHETALLPKSFFEGQEIKPGQQYYVEIVREYEDEVEVKYTHKEKDETEESADSKLEAMGTQVGSSNPGPGY